MAHVDSSSAVFPPEIESGLVDVCAQVAVVVEAVCGSRPRAKDVSERFGLNAKLGWQFWNVAFGGDAAAMRNMPNDTGFDALLKSARNAGLPVEMLARLDQARANLKGVFAVHAEDREMLEMLVDSRAENLSLEAAHRWRRQAFVGNSFSFGVRVKCLLSCGILFPAEPGRFSMVLLHGLIDLVRNRAGVRWPIASLVVEKEGEETTLRREPLFTGDWQPNEVPLLKEFCSQPVPVATRRVEGEVIYDELAPGLVGLTGKSTVFAGEIIHDVGPVFGTREGEVALFGSGVRTPAEFLICDHIVHQSLFPDVARELCVFSELATLHARDEKDRIEVPERLETLGMGLGRIRTADVPRYDELLNHVFGAIGHNPEEFNVFRARMAFPPIPTSVMIRHSMPTES